MKKYTKFLPYFLFVFCLITVSCSPEDNEAIEDNSSELLLKSNSADFKEHFFNVVNYQFLETESYNELSLIPEISESDLTKALFESMGNKNTSNPVYSIQTLPESIQELNAEEMILDIQNVEYLTTDTKDLMVKLVAAVNEGDLQEFAQSKQLYNQKLGTVEDIFILNPIFEIMDQYPQDFQIGGMTTYSCQIDGVSVLTSAVIAGVVNGIKGGTGGSLFGPVGTLAGFAGGFLAGAVVGAISSIGSQGIACEMRK